MTLPRANYLLLLLFFGTAVPVLSACGALPNLGIQPTSAPAVAPTVPLSTVPPASPVSGGPLGTAPATSTATDTPTSTPLPTSTATTTPTEPATEPATSTVPPTVVIQVVPTKLPTFTPVPPSANTTQVKIFLIAIGDNGVSGPMIGCGDSAIAVTRVVPETRAPLTAALNQLLSLHDKFLGQSGLYNALYQSNLQLQSVTLVSGVATINLTGSLSLGGECDNPRVEAQLADTALQFSTVRTANIFLNGKPLKEVLSLK